MLSKEYYEGKAAYLAGYRADCPYWYNTQVYYDWWEGYDDAEQEWQDSTCPKCGEDGGTTCGDPNCEY